MAEEVPVTVPATAEGVMEKPTAAADAPSPAKDASAEATKDQTMTEEAPKLNGDVDAAPSSDQPAEAPTNEEDTEMKDSGETGEGAEAKAPVTPAASAKKASNGSSKKRSSAVPEHKSRKLNKKKSKVTLNLEAKPGDLYLARMKGHPWWPAIICDEEMLPTVLLNSRPVTTALPDGTYKKPEYADGGKREGERTFPIMFLHTNEFAWMPNTDLQALTPEECQDVAEKGKSKALLEAYKIASESHDLAYYKEILLDHQEQITQEEQRQQEREAKKAAKAKRKSDATAPADDDDMEVDEEAEEKPKSKKRKKAAGDSDAEDEKPAKTPKTGTKLKLTTPKTPVSETAGKKRAAKPKVSAKKANAKGSGSDDEVVDTPMVEEKPLSPEELKEKKEKEIRYCRHKLQKGFLSRDTIPNDDDTKTMSTYLSKLETYPDLEASIIRATKIHKVLKAMIRLPSIPKDADYQFKKRSMDLLAKWNKVLQDDPSGADEKGEEKGEDKAEDKADEKPATNGIAKADETEAPAAEKAGEAEAKPSEEKPAEEKPTEQPAEKEAAVEAPATEAAEPKGTPAPAAEAVEAAA